jgi:hypothetical protein
MGGERCVTSLMVTPPRSSIFGKISRILTIGWNDWKFHLRLYSWTNPLWTPSPIRGRRPRWVMNQSYHWTINHGINKHTWQQPFSELSRSSETVSVLLERLHFRRKIADRQSELQSRIMNQLRVGCFTPNFLTYQVDQTDTLLCYSTKIQTK